MKIIFADWNGYGNEYMIYELEKKGFELVKCAYDVKASGEAARGQAAELTEALKNAGADFVFSYNYVPKISELCQEAGITYVSWIYDSPFMNLYSYTVPNPVNRIFVFDYGVYRQFESAGIKTVHYLPLAVCPNMIDRALEKKEGKYAGAKPLPMDISFVGSLYTEKKHRLYDKFDSISPYAKGYLDAIINAQKSVYGENILEKLLKPDVLAEMEKAYPCDPNPTTVMSPKQIYSQYVLSRQVTSLERTEILTMLGKGAWADELNLQLFTNDASSVFEGWKVNGPIDYYNEMPAVFKNSRINLNITLRSILTGIPLRAFDIMGAGGFLLTNYQAELTEYFVPGEDLVIYESYEDLMEKAEYYLSHEKERSEIAENGFRKVRLDHTLEKRIELMFEKNFQISV